MAKEQTLKERVRSLEIRLNVMQDQYSKLFAKLGASRIVSEQPLPKISSGLFIAVLHNETDITYSMVELARKLDCGVTPMQIDIPKRLVIDKIIFKEKTIKKQQKNKRREPINY